MAETKGVEGTAKLITDRELLTICNLTNLKLEFADLVKDRDEKTGKILLNHTISSLLDAKYDEFKKEWKINMLKLNINQVQKKRNSMQKQKNYSMKILKKLKHPLALEEI